MRRTQQAGLSARVDTGSAANVLRPMQAPVAIHPLSGTGHANAESTMRWASARPTPGIEPSPRRCNDEVYEQLLLIDCRLFGDRLLG